MVSRLAAPSRASVTLVEPPRSEPLYCTWAIGKLIEKALSGQLDHSASARSSFQLLPVYLHDESSIWRIAGPAVHSLLALCVRQSVSCPLLAS